MKSNIIDPGNDKELTKTIIGELPSPEQINEVAEATEFLHDPLRMKDQPFEYPISERE